MEDPYLRLDEEEDNNDADTFMKASLPLIGSIEPSTQGGWLAHQASPLPSRTPTPSTSPPTPPVPTTTHLTLTESLLPRDSISRSAFFLPEPGRTPLFKYNDTNWTILWCTAFTICCIASVFSFFVTSIPSVPTPYTSLIRIVPFLTISIILCTLLSYAYILLLNYFARPMLLITALFIPISLIFSALAAFSGSFVYSSVLSGVWGSTVGLRLFSLVPTILAISAARSVFYIMSRTNRTIDTIQLVTKFLLSNPPLLAISPALLFAALLGTLPFISLSFRLLLVGYGGSYWHIKPYAVWFIILVSFTWAWSCCIIRGMLRVISAATVGAWFFKRPQRTEPISEQIEVLRASISRACGPSFGTICLAAMLETSIGSVLLMLRGLRRVTKSPVVPTFIHPLSVPVSVLSGVLRPYTFEGYILPHAGITGEAFLTAHRRVRDITSVKRPGTAPAPYTMFSTLMTLTSLSLSMLFSLCAYLLTANTFTRPEHAPLSAILIGAVCFFLFWFCGGILSDIADALYICYCIDQDQGTRTCEEVYNIFHRSNSTTSNVEA